MEKLSLKIAMSLSVDDVVYLTSEQDCILKKPAIIQAIFPNGISVVLNNLDSNNNLFLMYSSYDKNWFFER